MRKFFLFVSCSLVFCLCGLISQASSDWEVPPKSLAPNEHHPKIQSVLMLQARATTLGQAQNANEFVRVIIEIEGLIDEAQLRALEVQIEARSHNLMRARVPAHNLREIAENVAGISYIRKPLSLVTLNTRRTEGLVHTGALLLQSAGYRGQNAKVAVVDLGFAQLSRAKKVGAINPQAIVDEQDYTDEGLETETSHGTGAAEIVHTIAPQAWLYLKKVADEVDLANAVDDAIAQGVQIINHSVGVANANFNDGTGIIAEIVDRARARGILWVNAAGNHAQSHWMGSFADQDGDRWLEFAPGREELFIKADFPGSLELYLTWDDWPRSSQDFDLFLYDAQGRLVASSQNYQMGYEQPTEEIQYVAWTPGTYRVRILARRVSRSNIRLKLLELGQRTVEPNLPEGSILTPADARGALAVGAISVRRWREGPQEPYSSQGPTSDGRIKPDLSGPDAVSNYTLAYFTGTSASAPHIAGAAALLLSQHPTWSADQLQEFLESQAIDLGALGKDNIYGAGKMDLSLGTLIAKRTITPTRVRPGDTVAVFIEARMPAGLYGGLVLRESLPATSPLALTPGPSPVLTGEGWLKAGVRASSPFPLGKGGKGGGLGEGCTQREQSYECLWPIVAPHEVKRLRYELKIPEDTPPGVYRWHGTVNDIPIEGDENIVVEKDRDQKTEVRIEVTLSVVRFYLPPPARVRFYDLRGALLAEERTSSSILEWRPPRQHANGVYLYVIEILQAGRVVRAQLGKLVILR